MSDLTILEALFGVAFLGFLGWVIRHGDVSWSETNFDDVNATWQTGDLCVT